MTSPAHWQGGDRVALVRTDDPDTRLRPGDQGTVTRWDPAQEQLHVRWDSGSTLSMLPGEGDQVRLIARAADEDGTEPEDPGQPDDSEPAPNWRQDISDPATGLSRLLSERCGTCILRLATRCTSAPSGPPRASGRSWPSALTCRATTR